MSTALTDRPVDRGHAAAAAVLGSRLLGLRRQRPEECEQCEESCDCCAARRDR